MIAYSSKIEAGRPPTATHNTIFITAGINKFIYDMNVVVCVLIKNTLSKDLYLNYTILFTNIEKMLILVNRMV